MKAKLYDGIILLAAFCEERNYLPWDEVAHYCFSRLCPYLLHRTLCKTKTTSGTVSISLHSKELGGSKWSCSRQVVKPLSRSAVRFYTCWSAARALYSSLVPRPYLSCRNESTCTASMARTIKWGCGLN